MAEVLRPSFSLYKAIEIATAAHEGQITKGGKPYITHPKKVMEMLIGETPRTVAILHDVVEDTRITFEDLKSEGCPDSVLNALKLITHPKDFVNTKENYFAYIRKIINSHNQFAIDVKFADLIHNTDRTRLAGVPEQKDLDRWGKYEESKALLRPHVSQYLREKEKTA
jgi:(p)ppGpp synthase/HD superfamily hydrolase